MPTYKLYYFDGRGRAELCRILLAYGNIEYEDVRVSSEEWTKLKPTMPMGQLPVLERDGDMLCKSPVIARFLADTICKH
ncbi:unnamed protein product [Soboliphyme baturini]|uniref:glutathione transferase n=1 Tax=Soboliphyme baturini TaxID=241478 RepID=A0A183IGK7_9BILA|nr:unnamed protein product [Soboliphyme baturini]